MKLELLNMGFIKDPDGSYRNLELGIKVKIVDIDKLEINTNTGIRIVSIKDLEKIMMGGNL
jgi:hypothetical protein